MRGTIYKLTNTINNKVYIGQTLREIKTRFCEHKRGNDNSYLYRAIKKYNWENFKQDILFQTIEVDETNKILVNKLQDFINDLEVMFISYYKSNNHSNGYNITVGGGGVYGITVSEETREKLRIYGLAHNAFKGKHHSEETKALLSALCKSRKRPKMTEETKRKLSEKNKGRIVSEEVKLKLREVLKGRVISLEHRKKISEANSGINHPNYGKYGKDNYCSKPVLQYDLDGNFIKEWESLVEVTKIIQNAYTTSLSAAAKGKIKYSAGFQWRYKKDVENIYTNIGKAITQYKSVLQYDLEGNFIREWKTMNEAYKSTGVDTGGISSCCKGKSKRSGNYIWKYKED